MNDRVQPVKFEVYDAAVLLIIAAAIIFTGLAIWKIAIIAAELFKIDM